MCEAKNKNKNLIIASIDIPSGWNVNEGKLNSALEPDLLVSLTLPKLAALEYKGIHILGGRFVPSTLYKEMNLTIPKYLNSDLIVEVNILDE